MEKDVGWSVFFEDENRYADFVNGIMDLQSKRVLGKDVKPYDARVTMQIRNVFRRGDMTKLRDVSRCIIFGVNFVVIDTELQENMDYAYPLRDMSYVYGEYEGQARKIRRRNRSNRRWKRADAKLKTGELLYDFLKTDKLKPTVIFLLYTGVEPWDGPTSIHDMLDWKNIPDEFRTYVQNHQINIIDVHRLSEDFFERFQTDVGNVLKLIRYSEDKDKLMDITQGNPYYNNMDKEAYDVAIKYVNNKKIIDEEKYVNDIGGYDMGNALLEILEDGRKEGREEGRLEILIDLVREGVLSIEDASKRAGMSENEFVEKM